MLTDEVLAYYQRLGEVSRLDRGVGRLEFLRTWDVLERTLPAAPADVLDVGGATGVYAGPLAAQGYRVHVIDPVPEHVVHAGALPGVTASVGDARTLDRPDASADAVLLFGPLYHLLDREDRRAAWREAGRVARPGAPIVGALISRFAALLDGYVKGHAADERFRAIVSRGLESGEHHNDTDVVGWFTTAYFHHPAEIAAEVAGAGLVLDRVVMVESAVWMTGQDGLTELLEDPLRRAELLARLRTVEDEPSLLGSSSHLLALAHRD